MALTLEQSAQLQLDVGYQTRVRAGMVRYAVTVMTEPIFPTANISSSTNANPSVVTTATPHSLVVGDTVTISGHTTNTAINGTWVLTTVGSSTTFSVPTAANGVGGATGTVVRQALSLATKRKALAYKILTNPNAYIDSFLSMVAADPGASLSWFQPTNIASSTNANPTVVTTAAAHGLVVGDVVEVTGHLVNTLANGVWTLATVGSTTTFTVPGPGNGVGAATGAVMKQESDITVNFTIQNNYNAVAGTYVGDVT